MSRDAQDTRAPAFLIPIGWLAFLTFLWPALVTFDPGDWPSPHQYPHNTPSSNACGLVGAWFAYYLQHSLGDGAYPLVLFATLVAFFRVIRGEVGRLWERVCGITLVVLCTSAAVHLITGPATVNIPVGPGGVVGFALGDLLTQNLSRVGTWIVLTASLFVGLIFSTEGWVLKLPGALKRVGEMSGRAVTSVHRRAVAAMPIPLSPIGAAEADEGEVVVKVKRKRGKKAEAAVEDATLFDEEEEAEKSEEIEDVATEEEVAQDEEDQDESSAGIATLKRKPKKAALKVNFPSAKRAARAEAYPKQIENWVLPSVELLTEPQYGFTEQQEALVREQAKTLERTLEEFRLDAHVVEIDTGPVITMFELRLGAGIKVSQISTLANDIARALKAHAIRVVAPISGKNTVGIEVPNITKETVRLRELMVMTGKKAAGMGLPLYLGKDAGGAALVGDLTKMPHLLIAGTTGSGKSVCLNSIILSLLMTKRPDHVKMILVDPKLVELNQFKAVPHLMCPIVTDMARAEKILEWAVTKMDERYELLSETGVKNISAYNALGEEEIYRRLAPASEDEKERINVHVPYVVIIIDELADLMMTSAKEVEHHLSRLAQKSRAVGIHIIVATQRPEAKVVTGLIKSNLPSRICFRVASRMDSRIVLDQNGGEVLLGQGDMLFLPPGSHKLMRAQGTYLDDKEIHAVLDDLSSRAKPEFHPELSRIKSADGEGPAFLRDPLLDDAVKVVVESKRGSVSLLQRRLTIGYSRASRLIDQMSEAGIVGEYKGSQAREVLLTSGEWKAMRQQVEHDLEQGYEADEEPEEVEDDEAYE